jgi:hypothetical protein
LQAKQQQLVRRYKGEEGLRNNSPTAQVFDPDWTVSQLRLGLMIIHDLFINKKEEAE